MKTNTNGYSGSNVNGWVEIDHKEVPASFPQTVQSMKPGGDKRAPEFFDTRHEPEVEKGQGVEDPFYISLGVQTELEDKEKAMIDKADAGDET